MAPGATSTSFAGLLSLLVLATPGASAFSLRSLLSRESAPSREESLSRRQDGNTTVIPAPIVFAPSQYWDGIDGPWSSFAIQVGNHVQNLRVMPGTASAATYVIGEAGCPEAFGTGCAQSRGGLFYPNNSLTWVDNSIYNLGIEKNLGLDFDVTTGYDTVTLGFQGAGGPTIQHSVVQVLAPQDYWLGIFGLRGDPTNFTTLNDPQPSFMLTLEQNDTIPSLSYGYTAGNQYRLNAVFGSLVLGGYDENRFDTTKNISVGMYTDINRDLLVYLQGVTTDTGSSTNLLPDGAISIFIDSTVGQIWLPESACSAFEDAFGLEWNSDFNYYLVNDTLHQTLTAQNPNVTFTLGAQESGGSTVDIVLPYGAFDLNLSYPYTVNPNSSYYFPLKRAANSTQYTLGRAFLQEAYLIADYDNRNFTVAPCTWDQNLVDTSSIKPILRANETQSQNDNSSSGTPVGAIAGGVVGGVVAAILIIGAIIFFLRRRKQNEKKRIAELEGKSAGDATNETSDSGKPFISAPMGGELGGDGEIHELTAPQKHFAAEMDSPFKTDPNQHGYSEMEGGAGYFAPGKGNNPAEMHGSTPIYEMAGSDVNELSGADVRRPEAPQEQEKR